MMPSQSNQTSAAPGGASTQHSAQAAAASAAPGAGFGTSATQAAAENASQAQSPDAVEAEAVVLENEPYDGEEEVVVAGDAEPLTESVSEKHIEELQSEKKAWEDRYMRLHAEWDTYRRRMTEQREVEKARATEKLVTDIIPVIDDFERTIAYADEHGTQGLLEGVKAVYAKLGSVLEKGGVVVLNPVNEPFNALDAQAVATVEDPSAYDETVREVYQKGYKMGTKVLRPAMVTVTTGGPKRETPPDVDEDNK